MKIGLVGCGNIGSQLAEHLSRSKKLQLAFVFDIEQKNSKNIVKSFKRNKPKVVSLDELLKKSDIIVEAAHKNIVKAILKNKSIDKKGKKIIFMSVGGIIENKSLVKKIKNAKIIIPSGAIAGLDAIKAIADEIQSLQLTTTKSPRGLGGAPYIAKNKIDIKKIKSKKTIFSGALEDAVEGFPQNINVAAALFLASSFKKLKITIIADPKAKNNVHEIVCKGPFGEIHTKTFNKPSKNPKTSQLAIKSLIAALENQQTKLKISS